jgi:hypothetical protein
MLMELGLRRITLVVQGMILRDEEGAIIFTGCRFLQRCESPLEAEVVAWNEGLALALESWRVTVWRHCP